MKKEMVIEYYMYTCQCQFVEFKRLKKKKHLEIGWDCGQCLAFFFF